MNVNLGKQAASLAPVWRRILLLDEILPSCFGE
jgi:hypothetical protein